jgi:WD40 repeat protein
MRLQLRALLPFLGVCLAACNQEYENPFGSPHQTATPPPGAALLLTSNAYGTRAGAPREVYAMNQDGSGLVRLTFCNGGARSCDTSEASAGRNSNRVATRRIPADLNGDGSLTSADGEGLVTVDLSRGLEGTLVSPITRVSGIDWSPVDDLIVYSGRGAGDRDDLYRIDSNGANNSRLTDTSTLSERRPRIDPSGTVAVFESIDAADGKGTISLFVGGRTVPVTEGGAAGEPLGGTPYRVGSDADPDFSPNAGSIVFRRLTAAGNGGLGFWDLLTVTTDGTAPTSIASGPRYRGAPDWGPSGIVFEEIDEAGRSSVVLVDPDGSNRRTLATAGSGLALSHPRWLQ